MSRYQRDNLRFGSVGAFETKRMKKSQWVKNNQLSAIRLTLVFDGFQASAVRLHPER